MKRDGIKKGIYILPNLFTTANLFCGFFAVIRAINGDFITAIWMLMLSGLFDFLDGRVARFTKGHSRFGMEYDSLVDLCSFGLAPAVMMYLWVLKDYRKYGWMTAFVFFACAALRLARFNVQASDVEKKTFQGLPTPAAAGCMITFILMWNYLFVPYSRPAFVAIVPFTVLLALLMVSNVRYKGFKTLEANKKTNFFLLVLLVGIATVIVAEPEVMLFIVGVSYVSFGVAAKVIGSARRASNFPDFVGRFFRVSDNEEEKEKGRTLKVVGIGQRLKGEGKSPQPPFDKGGEGGI